MNYLKLLQIATAPLLHLAADGFRVRGGELLFVEEDRGRSSIAALIRPEGSTFFWDALRRQSHL